MMPQNAFYVEKKRPLRLTIKAVRTIERVLFGNTGNRKGLAWETADQNIVRRYELLVDFGDIASDVVCVTGEVRTIRLLTELVPLAREDAPPANGFKTNPDTTDASKEIDEPKLGEGAPRGLGPRLNGYSSWLAEQRQLLQPSSPAKWKDCEK